LPAAVRLDIKVPGGLVDKIQAAPVTVPLNQESVMLPVSFESGLHHQGDLTLTIRALATQPGTPPGLSDSAHATPMDQELISILRSGLLPVMTETAVLVELITVH
jgi:hypothetical protein